MEEERYRMALETALRELRILEGAREAAVARERQGRDLVGKSARSGELTDRMAGLVETAAGRRQVHTLAPRIAAAEAEGLRLRQKFLEKRRERRQSETLVDETLAQDVAELDRRSQQAVDDWYGSRRFRELSNSRPDAE
jgi:hypothetical protein